MDYIITSLAIVEIHNCIVFSQLVKMRWHHILSTLNNIERPVTKEYCNDIGI